MSAASQILDAAFADIAERAKGLPETYLQRLDDTRVLVLAVADDVALGKVTVEQAAVATEQAKNSLVSTLVTAGLAARAEAQDAALSVIVAIIRAGLVAVA